MRSNLMYADTLMNFKVTEYSTNIPDIKKVLISLIGESQNVLELLNLRCNKIKEIVDLYESRI